MTISNKEIARHFHLLGKLSDLHGENPFKGKSYANAAFRIERLERPLASLLPDDIAKLDGIGPAIQEKISLLLDGKPIPALMKLLEATPAGVLDIMEIKGLGPKKVRTIWKDMGIESVGELYYACHENRLAHAKGFGEKTQSAVLNSIEFMQASQGKFHYASLESMATQLVEQMSALSSVKRASLTGAIRRCCEILEEISLLVIAPDPHQLIVELGSLMMVNATENPILAEKNGVPIHIYVASEAHWYRDLFLTTGPAAHADRFQPAETLESERVVYEAAGAPISSRRSATSTRKFHLQKPMSFPKKTSKVFSTYTPPTATVCIHLPKWPRGVGTWGMNTSESATTRNRLFMRTDSNRIASGNNMRRSTG